MIEGIKLKSIKQRNKEFTQLLLMMIYFTFSSIASVVGKEGKENEEKDPTPCGIEEEKTVTNSGKVM